MNTRQLVQRHLAEFGSFAVWGTGGLSRLAVARWLPNDRDYLVVDGDPERIGCLFEGRVVQPVKMLLARKVDCLIICIGSIAKARATARCSGFTGQIFHIYDLLVPKGRVLSECAALKIDLLASRTSDRLIVFLADRPQILVNCSYRLARFTRTKWILRPLFWMFSIWHFFNCIIFSIQLPIDTQIGPGLVFAHHGGIVFAKTAQIGRFFTIYHGCTIGRIDSRGAPVIGDHVTVFANSMVIGSSKVKDFVRVGAMSLVLNLECPEGATVVGIPAAIKKKSK